MKRLITGLSIFTLLLTSCKNDDGGSSTSSSFNRSAMLEHYANNIILPNVAEAAIAANELKVNVDAYIAQPSSTTLETVQNSWKTATASFVKIAAYNFGPGETTTGVLNEKLGTFPVSETTIESYAATNDTLFSTNNDWSSRGFYGLEYLLFQDVNDLASDANTQAYAKAVVNDIVTQLNALQTEWDSYKTTFIGNDGTEAGSSVSLLFNNFSSYYEALKNYKVGLPAGTRPGQTGPDASQVESLYAAYSKELMQIHLEEVWNLYAGIGTDGVDGKGFDDYLKTVSGGSELLTATVTQFNVIREKMDVVQSSSLTWQVFVVNETTTAEELSTELQRHTRYFKSDMSSLLGIQITYQSGDGD